MFQLIKKSYAKPLYNLTDLQQASYQRFKMGPKETLNTLQSLMNVINY